MAASREDRTYVDAQGVTIHYYVWKADEPRAIIQLAHGLGEYATRYEWLVGRLVAAGYTVYADDHRGHGQTGLDQYDGDQAKLGRLGPGGMPATVEAVHRLTRTIRAENPGSKVVLLGHSWGSILAQLLVNEHSADYDAVILSGSAFRTFAHMNGGDLNAKHKHLGTTGYEWLSRDPAVVAAAAADPLMFSAKALKLFGLVDSLRLLGKPAKGIEHDLPLLIQVGGDDSFGGTKSAELLAESYLKRGGLTDVELIVYTDARHEIFNETNKDEVVADTLAWLADRVG
ncbi:alpha/beta hydrolase [Leifsonia bigeumensis]|uniref:Alpha/beta hydrolase n=1 Tax=Leifsonella bigeumensis TaxID=433643 RepID=A0ABP7F9I2_9MICO